MLLYQLHLAVEGVPWPRFSPFWLQKGRFLLISIDFSSLYMPLAT